MVNIMNLIKDRHSVRQYKDVAVEDEKKALLENYASELSAKSGLRIKVVFDDPEGFNSALARYGRFRNVKNYIALLGNSGMDEAAGYYGEAIVLKAQELGLNTCWVGLSFNKKVVKKLCNPSEKIYCAIALGYGENQGASHKVKTFEAVTSIKGTPPENFAEGVEAALLAPTAMNQQNFVIKCREGQCRIVTKHWSPYAKLDLGIVKYHFEKVTGLKVYEPTK